MCDIHIFNNIVIWPSGLSSPVIYLFMVVGGGCCWSIDCVLCRVVPCCAPVTYYSCGRHWMMSIKQWMCKLKTMNHSMVVLLWIYGSSLFIHSLSSSIGEALVQFWPIHIEHIGPNQLCVRNNSSRTQSCIYMISYIVCILMQQVCLCI